MEKKIIYTNGKIGYSNGLILLHLIISFFFSCFLEKYLCSKMNKVALLLGSNLDNRLNLLYSATNLLEKKAGAIIAKSSIYETPPWGYESENSYLNRVLIIETSLSPSDLLDKCLETELDLGRIRISESYTDRTIDIDIILYNEDVIDLPNLSIPHPKMQDRRFCLVPLNEVVPEWNVPTFNKTVASLLQECPDNSEITILDA